MCGIPLLDKPKLNRALTQHSHITHLFIVLSRSLISSQCLSTELFKTSTCIFNLSASSLCLSASKRHCDSHLNLFSRKQEYWEQSAQGTHKEVSPLWYLVLESDGDNTGTFSLGFSFCSLKSLSFSRLSSNISWAWLIARHGFGVPGSPVVMPECIHGGAWTVPESWTALRANWALDSKCDGGTKSFWLFPK